MKLFQLLLWGLSVADMLAYAVLREGYLRAITIPESASAYSSVLFSDIGSKLQYKRGKPLKVNLLMSSFDSLGIKYEF